MFLCAKELENPWVTLFHHRYTSVETSCAECERAHSNSNRFNRDSELLCVVGRQRGHSTSAVYVVMHDVRTHGLYLCVGSTAPSLNILIS